MRYWVPGSPRHMLPDKLMETLESEHWKLLLINSEYKTASDEVNAQLDAITGVLKQYDPTGMLIGEAPCTKDMIEVTDEDFRVVNTVSIAAIFIIIALVTKSFSLPFILVAVIEFAIFINLGLPYYTNTSLPFIAPICISTIQLGATVDYAILMTTRYKLERSNGQSKTDAVTISLATSIPSVIVSALGLFAATFGVAIYSDIDIISSLCNLMARGAHCQYVLCYLYPAVPVHAAGWPDHPHKHWIPPGLRHQKGSGTTGRGAACGRHSCHHDKSTSSVTPDGQKIS